jgi:hypothetical protein
VMKRQHRANNAPLLARRDFPRLNAELIDVPFADDHLDRGYRDLTAIHSLGAALPLGSQELKLKLDCVSIVSHHPPPSSCKCARSAVPWSLNFRERLALALLQKKGARKSHHHQPPNL